MVLFWFLQVQFDVMKETLKLSPIFLMKKKIESYMFWVEIQNIESQWFDIKISASIPQNVLNSIEKKTNEDVKVPLQL